MLSENLNEMALGAEAEVIGYLKAGVVGEFQHIFGGFDTLLCDVGGDGKSHLLMKQL